MSKTLGGGASMAKILDRKVAKENGRVKVTETVENLYTIDQLINMKTNTQRQKQQVIQQMKELKERFDLFEQKEKEIDKMIELASSESIEIPDTL